MRLSQSKARSPVTRNSDLSLKVAQLLYVSGFPMSSNYCSFFTPDPVHNWNHFGVRLHLVPISSSDSAHNWNHFDVCLHLVPIVRARRIPYSSTAAALDALRELILPYIGIERTKSHFSLTSLPTPLPSFPITMAIGPVRLAS